MGVGVKPHPYLLNREVNKKLAIFGFGGNGERIRKQAASRLEDERRRRKEVLREEKRRKEEIEYLKKREQSLIARAQEREALTRKRRAEKEAREARFGRFSIPKVKVSKKTKRAVGKAVTRKRSSESKIGWF